MIVLGPILNMNIDFLQQLGWRDGQGCDLNDPARLGDASGWMLKGMAQWGEEGLQNFHRGGSQGHCDGTSYGCVGYRQAIAEVQQAILAAPNLLEDGRRAAADIPHV